MNFIHSENLRDALFLGRLLTVRAFLGAAQGNDDGAKNNDSFFHTTYMRSDTNPVAPAAKNAPKLLNSCFYTNGEGLKKAVKNVLNTRPSKV